MNYPDFFDSIETISLQDNLSNFLGTFENGIIEFSYLDIVKNSGHSCPTVAGAYLLVLKGLKALYPDSIPQRGEIEVFFKEDKNEGVTGVIASVITHITGATELSGFKGIKGKFSRIRLMHFNENIDSSIKLQRVDTKESIEIDYDPSIIKIDPKQSIIMQKLQQNIATDQEKKEFEILWQQRVNDIFNKVDKVINIKYDSRKI